jgi:hypothetical protein
VEEARRAGSISGQYLANTVLFATVLSLPVPREGLSSAEYVSSRSVLPQRFSYLQSCGLRCFRRTTRQNHRVTIFGSARLKPNTTAYEAVKQFAAELTKMGCDIVTGGGPGLMRAANAI